MTQIQQIQVIQTPYKGYHFRSRTEARWAVYFDTIAQGQSELYGIEHGWSWEYEPEGFDLGFAGWYLPDFRFDYTPEDQEHPSHFNWVEIKGVIPTPDECKKMSALCAGTHSVGYILFGVPGRAQAVRFEKDGTQSHPRPFPKRRLDESKEERHIEIAAVLAARSARFEHGQQGATL